jgi:hypothetical protein
MRDQVSNKHRCKPIFFKLKVLNKKWENKILQTDLYKALPKFTHFLSPSISFIGEELLRVFSHNSS